LRPEHWLELRLPPNVRDPSTRPESSIACRRAAARRRTPRPCDGSTGEPRASFPQRDGALGRWLPAKDARGGGVHCVECFFNAIPHGPLMKSVARRVSDGQVLSVIKAWLNAPVNETTLHGRSVRATHDGQRAATGLQIGNDQKHYAPTLEVLLALSGTCPLEWRTRSIATTKQATTETVVAKPRIHVER
jgi:hypothetical protein